jgi:hypothetical protein
MLPRVVSPLEENMYEFDKYYMIYCRNNFLVMYDIQNDIIIGDALICLEKLKCIDHSRFINVIKLA